MSPLEKEVRRDERTEVELENVRLRAQLTAAQSALRAEIARLTREKTALSADMDGLDKRAGELVLRLANAKAEAAEAFESALREAEAARGEAVDLLNRAYGDQQSGNSLGLWMDMRDFLNAIDRPPKDAARAQEASNE